MFTKLLGKHLVHGIHRIKDLALIHKVNFRAMPAHQQAGAMARLALKYFFDVYDAPISLVIAITGRCQCRCRHCGVTSFKDVQALSLGEICGALDDYRAMGGIRVVFTGGEPLLRDDLHELVSHARRIGLGVFINTNGLLFDDLMAVRLREAGICNVEFSLDALTQGKMDENRRMPGILDKVKKAMSAARRNGVIFSINTVGFKENLDGELLEIIEFARAAGAAAVRVVEPVAIGEWDDLESTALTEDEKRRYDAHYEAGFVIVGMIGDFTDDCSGLNGRLLNINPDGEVTPCAYMPLSFGNIRRTPLRDIIREWKGRTPQIRYRELKCPVNDPRFRREYLGY